MAHALKRSILLQRAIFIALFFFLNSCCRLCPDWSYEQTITSCSQYNSGRLSYYPQNDFRGLGLEITKGATGFRTYLNVYCLSFPQSASDSRKTAVTIAYGEIAYEVLAYRFDGAQRLLLPDEAAADIISKLLDYQIVTISAGRYCTEIKPEGFAKAYTEMNLKFGF